MSEPDVLQLILASHICFALFRYKLTKILNLDFFKKKSNKNIPFVFSILGVCRTSVPEFLVLPGREGEPALPDFLPRGRMLTPALCSGTNRPESQGRRPGWRCSFQQVVIVVMTEILFFFINTNIAQSPIAVQILIPVMLRFSDPSPYSSYVTCIWVVQAQIMSFQLSPAPLWFSGSSLTAGAAAQAFGQMPQSPAEVADPGAEDVLELQLQQLTLAQFAVATMDHAIPLLEKGRSNTEQLQCLFYTSWCWLALPLFLSCLSEGSHVFHHVLELLCDALLLLGDTVSELVWDDRSLVGMELASQNTTLL